MANTNKIVDGYIDSVVEGLSSDCDLSQFSSRIKDSLTEFFNEISVESSSDISRATKDFIDLYANFGCGSLGCSCGDTLAWIMSKSLNFEIVGVSDKLVVALQDSIVNSAIEPDRVLGRLKNDIDNFEVDGMLRYVVLDLSSCMDGETWICKTDAPGKEIQKIIDIIERNYNEFPGEDLDNPDNEHYIDISNELALKGYSFDYVYDSGFDDFRNVSVTFSINDQPEFNDLPKKNKIKDSINCLQAVSSRQWDSELSK